MWLAAVKKVDDNSFYSLIYYKLTAILYNIFSTLTLASARRSKVATDVAMKSSPHYLCHLSIGQTHMRPINEPYIYIYICLCLTPLIS